ncbi:MAG: hypothetical protein PF444_03030 [Bacteroidales bacterium]|jgi:hypothetical protein|nr:hypothetical protein [Bacteroidales bacterium]
MNNSFICIFLLLALTRVVSFAQEQNLRTNVHYQDVLQLSTPLLHTKNPAALSFNLLDSIRQVGVSYTIQNGDFKPVMESGKSHQLGLYTESFRRINKTRLYSAFRYTKNWEKDIQYSNVYNAYRGTPYLFVDTVSNVSYDKEEYQINCKMAHQFNQTISLAGEVDYKLGLGAQNKDPRSLNKLVHLKNKVGILADAEAFKLGLDIYYNYFNEDIDITTVRENASYEVYALTGLGTYSKHNSTRFYRLYKEHTYGYDFQIDLGNNILEFGLNSKREEVLDGRRENGANWSAIKTDSYLNTRNWHIKDVLTFNSSEGYHQLILKYQQSKVIGTELLQVLEKVKLDHDIYQWKTISEEDKYAKSENSAQINYTYTQLKAPFLRDYSLGFGVLYFKKNEKYNFEDLETAYKNIHYHLYASKLFQKGHHSFETRIDANYKSNISNIRNLEFVTSITDLIIIPDLEFNTSNSVGGGITLNYIYTNSKKQNYYIEGKYAIQHTDNTYFNKKEKHYTSLSLGLMF